MPTLPPLEPERSASGIVVDPNTQQRIVPATRRADGTMRKELRIRPGFTPQEDVGLFRSRRQQAAESRGTSVPGAPAAKRSVPGAPASGAGGGGASDAAKSKAAKKNEKRKEKKKEAKDAGPGGGLGKDVPMRDAWDEEDEPVGERKPGGTAAAGEAKGQQADREVDKLAEELEKKAKV